MTVVRYNGEVVSPPPQPKHPGGCKPPTKKAEAADQECRLKLRPIWVLEKGKTPDLKSGIFEAAPEGFERVPTRPTNLEPTAEGPVPQGSEAHEIPPPQDPHPIFKGPVSHSPSVDIAVTKPKRNMPTSKKKKVGTKKTAQKSVMIRTPAGNVVKAMYWE